MDALANLSKGQTVHSSEVIKTLKTEKTTLHLKIVKIKRYADNKEKYYSLYTLFCAKLNC